LAKKQAIQNLAIRYRPREKAQLRGFQALSNYELLALIIGSGQRHCNVLEIAKKVEKQLFTQPKQLPDQQSLTQIFGVGQILASKILASLELGERFQKNNQQQITQAQQIFTLSVEFASKKQEYCLAFYLNGRQELLSRQVITKGSLNFNFIEPRDIFAPAFLLGANSFILAHNHPSNDPTPSEEDLLMTKRIAELAELMGVKLLDHLVICRSSYVSLKERHQELFNV
jgi:DNA repair protein RadC